MTEKERQKAMQEGNLAEYYQKQAAQENQTGNWKVGKIRLLTKEKHKILDEKYNLLEQVTQLNLQLNKINLEIEELKK